MSKKIWLTTMTGLGLLAGASLAQACTTGAWSNSFGDATAGGPEEATELPRYSGACAMEVSNGSVQDNSPADETQMISRFYVLPSGDGEAVIYTTFSDEPAAGAAGTEVYSVVFNGASDQLEFTTVGGGTTTAAVNPGAWNFVEINWSAGATMSIWVNADAPSTPTPTTTVNAGSGAGIDSARLGAEPVTGAVTMTFDDYEARRTTSIGRSLFAGDVVAPFGQIDIFDGIGVLRESAKLKVNEGAPDCTLDGKVDIFDGICTLRKSAGLRALDD